MIKLAKSFTEKIKQDNLGAHAACAAFFIFLSIFPILILITSILPYTPLTEADLVAVVTGILPAEINPLVVGIVGEMYDRSVAVVSLSAVFVIWSAAKGILALVRGLNVVQSVNETRNYFVLRFWSCVYTVIVLASLIFILFVVVFGNQTVQKLIELVPQTKYLLELLMNFRYLFTLVFVAILFDLIFSFMPNQKSNPILKLPGAILASFGWTIFSWGFSIYIDHFGNFDMYGSLTTIVIIMLWLYFNMYIMLLGDEINSFLQPLIRLMYLNRRMKRRYQKSLKKKK